MTVHHVKNVGTQLALIELDLVLARLPHALAAEADMRSADPGAAARRICKVTHLVLHLLEHRVLNSRQIRVTHFHSPGFHSLSATRSSATPSGVLALPCRSRNNARRSTSRGQPNWNASDAATAESRAFTSDCEDGLLLLRKISTIRPSGNLPTVHL